MKRPYSVLVVSGHSKGIEFVRTMLPPADFSPVSVAGSAGEAQRMMISSVFDIIVIDTPLPDRFGHELALDFSQSTQAGIMLMVRNDIFEHAASKVESSGVLTVAKPISRQGFYQDIKLLAATRERLAAAEKKNETLQEKMDEIRLINRAKWVLIDKEKMSEPQAHRYIEKEAMDTRLSKREVAQKIIIAHESIEDEA